jgi:hypothetical protein
MTVAELIKVLRDAPLSAAVYTDYRVYSEGQGKDEVVTFLIVADGNKVLNKIEL